MDGKVAKKHYLCSDYFISIKMAKRIKAIKCPQCGSTKATETRTDYYRCDSCNTEFFIDSDDININHRYEELNPINKTNLKYIIVGVAIFLGVFFFLWNILSTNRSSASYSPSSVSAERNEVEKEVVFWDRIEGFHGFANATGDGMILVIGNRGSKKGYSVSDEKQSCFAIYQAIDQKQIMIKPINGMENTTISDAKVQSFENGDVYAIINKKKLFKLNIATYELKEIVFESLKFTEFEKGVYQIEFAYDNEGFKVINELGKELYYFPVINKVYSNDAFYDARSKKTPDAKKQAAFQFSDESLDFPDEKTQLIKYYYWHQTGYPIDIPRFAWQKDYGGSGIFTDRSPYRKVLILPYNAQTARLISWKDFTPERDYLSGTVLAYNDKEVLIAFTTTVSGNEIIQLLDAETAEVKWTMPSDFQYMISDEVVKVKEGYLFTKYKESWLFNTQNKESKYLEWNIED